MVNQIEMSYLEAFIQAEYEDQENILLARNYHKGAQTVYLTDRLKDFLEMHGTKVKFRLNICQTVVTAVTDEMNVIGFDSDEPADPKTGKKKQSNWAWTVWRANRMDAVQDDLHEATLRDREAFMIVDYDDEKRRPRFTMHERYIATEAGGDGTGCWMLYENDDINQPPLAAVQQWTEAITDPNSNSTLRMRRTVYYPDHMERWVYNSGWEHYEEEGRDWVIPWVDKDKKPLGIPVIHFKNVGMSPEAWEALPMQDAINKMALDVLGSADLGGFPIMKGIGFMPTTDGKALAADGSNAMKIKPMSWIGTTKSKSEADVGKIEATDVTPLMNTLIELIAIAAQITGTPVSRFVMTRQVSGAETVKEQDKPLQRKVEKRRGRIGNSWEDVMAMARKLDNHYGNALLDESVSFSTLWRHSLSMDDLAKKQSFGVPTETIWAELGYTQDQIAQMKMTPEYLLKMEKLLWEAAVVALDATVSLETFLERVGWDKTALKNFGTQQLAAIKLKQEDTIPPTGQ